MGNSKLKILTKYPCVWYNILDEHDGGCSFTQKGMVEEWKLQ